jgi:hypothetical protein
VKPLTPFMSTDPRVAPAPTPQPVEDESEQSESQFCECDLELTMQELDTGKCQSCGKPVLP